MTLDFLILERILSFKRTVLLQGTFILLGSKQFSAWVFSEHLGSSSSVTGSIDFHRVFTCILNVTRGGTGHCGVVEQGVLSQLGYSGALPKEMIHKAGT